MKPEFSIGTVTLPSAGRIGICALPGLDGDLDSDLGVIFDWRPTVVLSMTEQHEMEACECQDLGIRLEATGISWIHLPIVDYGVLEGIDADRWFGLSKRLHGVLESGGNVLLHCRGGLGRSGMIALRLLVEDGKLPEHALDILRQVRPGAVETQQQYEWASMKVV